MTRSVPFFSWSCDFSFSFQREVQITLRGLLRLLDEAMQQDHPALIDAKQHASDAALRQAAPDFPKARAQRPHQRHADRPGKLHVLDVLANDLSVGGIKAPDPFAD